MEDIFSKAYGVELFYEKTPLLNKHELLLQLNQNIGQVESLDTPVPPGVLYFVFPEYQVSVSGRNMPVQALITLSEKPVDLKKMAFSLQQTWEWEEGAETVAKCEASLVVNDLFGVGLDYKTRLTLFHKIVKSVLEVHQCRAIHWQLSQQLIDPIAYLETVKQPNFDPFYCAVNVRVFQASEGIDPEILMDTLGLTPLGLPDLQCHFKGLEAEEVGRKLYDVAYFIFEKGDVLQNGTLIEGLIPGQPWKCKQEASLAKPERTVVDLNPGSAHAAGTRKT